MKLKNFSLKLKKLRELCLNSNMIPIVILILFLYDFFPKDNSRIEMSDIKLNRAKNFITDISRDMNAATWDIGKRRMKTTNELRFQDGMIQFQQCSSQTKKDVINTFKQYQHLVIKEHDIFGKYFCIDTNILVRMSFHEDDCKLFIATKWNNSYSNCTSLI